MVAGTSSGHIIIKSPHKICYRILTKSYVKNFFPLFSIEIYEFFTFTCASRPNVQAVYNFVLKNKTDSVKYRIIAHMYVCTYNICPCAYVYVCMC